MKNGLPLMLLAFLTFSCASEDYAARYKLGMTVDEVSELLPVLPSIVVIMGEPPEDPILLESEARYYFEVPKQKLRIVFNHHRKVIGIEDLQHPSGHIFQEVQ